MYNELRKIWKDAIVPKVRHCPGICLEGLRKATKSLKLAGLRAKISTEDLPNTKQEWESLIRDIWS
jgi:hypothetical protein